MDTTINTGLRSLAMRAVAISIGAVVLIAGTVTAGAVTLTGSDGPAAAGGQLGSAITTLEPYVYWPLGGSLSDGSGNACPGLGTAGVGSAVGHGSSNPPGGSGGSVTFTPGGRQSGRYLQSAERPVPVQTVGTVIVWFKTARTLPPWWQTLLVDNGAPTTYGAGFFLSPTGRLAYTSAADTFDPSPGAFGVHRRTISGPLNDGRWHMVAFVDQYTQQGYADQWKPSLIYLDGRVVDRSIVGWMTNTFGRAPGSRLLVGAGLRQVSKEGRFVGSVADVALFDRLLTADEVAGVWQAGN